MEDLTRDYSEQEIIHFAKAAKRDEASFKWLMENDCKELAALCDVLVYGNTEAFDWLKKNRLMTLLAFVNALNDDEEAFRFLLKGTHKVWAAVVNSINGDEKAKKWLLRFDMKHFLLLVDSLSLSLRRTRRGGGFAGGGVGRFGGLGGGGTGVRW